MFKFGGLVLPSSKTAVLAAVSLLLAIAGIAAVRQLTSAQAAPAAGPSVIHSVNLSSRAAPDSSPTQPIDTNQVGNSSQTTVTINGQSIDVPENGSLSQTIQSDGSTTTVDVQSSNHSTTSQGGSTNNSSVNVRVRSISSSGDSL